MAINLSHSSESAKSLLKQLGCSHTSVFDPVALAAAAAAAVKSRQS